MIQEAKTQVKVGVGIEKMWKALSMDLRLVLPKIMSNVVEEVQILEGDGGLATVFLFNFGSNVSTMKYQKEKLIELDESKHQVALQVIEGGHLNLGFSLYITSFKLTAMEDEQETLVDVKVTYDQIEAKETHMPSETTKSALAFIKCLENYLVLNNCYTC